jgi:hypothetical protein
VDERVKAALQDRATGKRRQLLRLVGAKAQAAPPRGDDG